jgi:hypothetical protein
VHGLARRALRDEAGDARGGEPDGVGGDGRQVELLGGGVEEAEGGDVDAGAEGDLELRGAR